MSIMNDRIQLILLGWHAVNGSPEVNGGQEQIGRCILTKHLADGGHLFGQGDLHLLFWHDSVFSQSRSDEHFVALCQFVGSHVFGSRHLPPDVPPTKGGVDANNNDNLVYKWEVLLFVFRIKLKNLLLNKNL